MELFFALLPFILITVLLGFMGVRALYVMSLAFSIVALSLFSVWSMPVSEIWITSFQGALAAVDLVLLIFGVLGLFVLFSQTGHMDKLAKFFSSLSSDVHVHVILLGFFFVMFLEGIAGFGLPALIVAPLLVLAGAKPVAAITVSLFTDAVAVVFGAFGTPVVLGLQGFVDVTWLVALIAGTIIVFLPTLLLLLFSYLQKEPLSVIRPFLRFSFVSGVVTAAVFVLFGYSGPVFPSVVASVVGLVITLLLMPHLGVPLQKVRYAPILPVVYSYLAIVVLLLFSRLNVFGFGDVLKGLSFSVVNHSFSAYHPGFLILLVLCATFVFLRPSKKIIAQWLSEIQSKLFIVGPTLLVTLMFVYLVRFSPDPSIPSLIASLFGSNPVVYIFLAPLLGMFGSFVSGSTTVSNVLFASVQSQAALSTGLSEVLVLSLQTMGGGAGNLLAIHNLLAVLAVVSVAGGMRSLLRIHIWLGLFLCLVSSILGWLFFTLLF